jgi:hypothetical protein
MDADLRMMESITTNKRVLYLLTNILAILPIHLQR